MKLAMNIDEIHEFLRAEFPQVSEKFRVEEVSFGQIRVRMLIDSRNIRPGGTVSGPSIFSLADVSVFLAIQAVKGPVKHAVTTNCSIDFMRRPELADLISETRLLKFGKRLVVGNVLIRSFDRDEPVAQASLTYSMPS